MARRKSNRAVYSDKLEYALKLKSALLKTVERAFNYRVSIKLRTKSFSKFTRLNYSVSNCYYLRCYAYSLRYFDFVHEFN